MGLIEIKALSFEPRLSQKKLPAQRRMLETKAPLNVVSARFRAHRRRQTLAVVRITVTGHATCEFDLGGNRLKSSVRAVMIRTSRHASTITLGACDETLSSVN
jgi:hypothetical protein